MSESEQRMIDYITQEVIHRPSVHIDLDTQLVSSGLIDSFALVDVLLQLEDVTNMRIPAGKVRAQDMNTIRLMFALAYRLGKPRK